MLVLLVTSADLADSGHPSHPGLAWVGRLLLAPLGEEEVYLVIIARGAVDALPHQHRPHEVRLCVTHRTQHNPRLNTGLWTTISMEPESGFSVWNSPPV